MIQNLEIDLDNMVRVLKSDGIFVINNYLSGKALNDIHDTVLNLCALEGGNNYSFGKDYVGPALNGFKHGSIIRETFDAEWMKDLYSSFINETKKGKNKFGCRVHATHDYIATTNLARNGWLHFDRYWCLKFLLYLKDTDVNSGAFSCCVGSVQQGEELRKAEWKLGKRYAKIRNRISIDFKHLLNDYNIEPVNGSAGTLIVFDTDVFHMGGIVQEGHERLIVRLHCQ